jgi:hypothetical protein
MRFKRLSMNDAKAIVAQYDNMSDAEFQNLIDHWAKFDTIENDPAYDDYRQELLRAFQDALVETEGKMTYLLDLRVGICLYQLMPLGKDFSLIDANNDDYWRYISVKVMPDITYLRYPDPAKGDIRINSKRFYRGTRRIWLKTLWWYIHLSWQGSPEATFEVLKDNATDNINKLIETPGKGYRLSLYRQIMRAYAATSPHKAKDFAAVTKLNNAKCISVEPALIYGGEPAYAKQLVSEVTDREAGNEFTK